MDNRTARTAQHIQHIVCEVSKAFQEVAQLFPVLSKELTRSRLTAEGGIREIYAQKEDTRAQLGLTGDSENAGGASEFTKHYKSLYEINSQEKKLIAEFEAEVNRFFELDDSVSGIIDLTEDIQVIALNSLVKAAKSGHAGKGFAHLTQRLREASSGLKALAVSLQEVEHKTRDSFIDYKQELSEFTVFENRIKGELENLPGEISGLVDTFMDPFLETLGNIGISYDKMKESLYMIMETIQNQDIIAQSYEQIILALSRISDPVSEESEDLLNHFAFTEQVSGFCYELVQTTGESISRISQTLLIQLNVLDSHVGDISRMQKELLKKSTSGDLAVKIRERIDSIHEKSEYSTGKKKEIGIHMGTIHESIQNIGGSISDFTERVRKFMPVILTAKIEVAKRNELKELKETISDLEQDIGGLENYVTKADTVAVQVGDALEHSARELGEISRKAIESVLHMSETITGILQEVQDSITTMEQLMKQFQVLSSSFNEVFATIPGKIDKLVQLEDEYDRISAMFKDLGGAAGKEKERILNSLGLEKWVIKDDSLKELINKFTIFSHKKLAGELTGITIEEKEGEEGDVLFF